MYLSAASKLTDCKCIIHDSWLLNESPFEASLSVKINQPDIVGIQVYKDTVEWTRQFIKAYKHWGNKYSWPKFIIGGPYATVVGEKARIETGADICVQGEADSDFQNMIDRINNSETLIKMPFADVNKIPIPDYSSVNLQDYWPYLYQVSMPTKGKRIGIIQRSRGCCYSCTFCSSAVTSGHIVRIRNDENVLNEIDYIIKYRGVNEIWFADDNVIVNYTKAINLFEKLEQYKLNIRLPLGIRWENVDYPMAIAMKKAGVYFTGIGIESGNPRVLKRIKKSINQEGLRRAIKILDNVGIITIGFFIFGLATETRKEMEDTVRWAINTKLNHAQFGIFIPYPGSEDCNEKSLLPHNELVKIQRNATLRFYLRPRIIYNFLKHFQISQIKAIANHHWVQSWFIKEK